MRGPLAALTAVLLLAALPGCLDAATVAEQGEPLVEGIEAEGPEWEVYRESATVPLWVGAAGARAHSRGATQFIYEPAEGFSAVVVEARWESESPEPLNTRLKLLLLGHDRTILGEVEGPSPLVIRLDAASIPVPGPYTAYAVGAEDTPGVTMEQPYELAVSFRHAPGPAPGNYSAFE